MNYKNATYYAASAAAEDWDLSGAVGWNPDYDDPSTYLDILKTTNSETTKSYMAMIIHQTQRLLKLV